MTYNAAAKEVVKNQQIPDIGFDKSENNLADRLTKRMSQALWDKHFSDTWQLNLFNA